MIKKILGAIGRFFRRIRFKPLIICAVVILALGAAYVFFLHDMFFSKETVTNQQFEVVRKGTISKTVSGSGPIESSNRIEINPKLNGTLTKVFFKEGDRVKAGDLMYELDDSELRLNVEKVQNSIDQTMLSQNSTVKSISGLNVTAPISGLVTGISIDEGDTLNRGAAILTITDQSKLILTVPVGGAGIEKIRTGQRADVYLQDVMQSIEGNVTAVGSKAYPGSFGGEQYDVEVTVNNPGSLREGMKAGLEININGESVTSTDVGTLKYIKSEVIKCETGGTVTSLKVKENQYVKSGAVLVEITNDELSINKDTTDLKLKDLQSQLEAAQKQLDNCRIYAPIDGVIVSQDADVDNVVQSGSVLSTITDAENMEFSISIDELDIADIKTGQKVNITIDALPETSAAPLSGTVSGIASEGESSNGVTTYPVTIKIDRSDNLKVGMNANAEILVEQKEDVLYVPIEAIRKAGDMNYVLLRSDTQASGSSQGSGANAGGSRNVYAPGPGMQRRPEDGTDAQTKDNAVSPQKREVQSGSSPEQNSDSQDGNRRTWMRNGENSGSFNGFNFGRSNNRQNGGSTQNAQTVMRPVKVGINNETYIEIVSGLNEGDQVALPVLATASSNNSNSNGMMFGLGGGNFMGGGNFGGNNVRQRTGTQPGSSRQTSGNSRQNGNSPTGR